MKRIGCFGHTIDPLFLSKRVRSKLIVFIPKSDKRFKKYYKDFETIEFDFKSQDSIEETCDSDILKSKGFQQSLRQSTITHFLVSHRSSKELFSILKKLTIEPIGNNYTWATRLENKDYFDRLLKKLSLPKPRTLSSKDLFNYKEKVVLQEVNSFGSFGTKIISPTKALKVIQRVKNKRSFLIREFIEGNVYGLTMLIKNKSYVLSALRQQCYFDNSLLFAGIQWVATDKIPKKTVRSIEKSFNIIARDCIKNNIEGILNFDFIISKNEELYILECNPRPSSATPHLLSHNELLHGLDLSEFIVNKDFHLKTKPQLPSHHFQGALFDIMVPRNMKSKEVRSCRKRLFISQKDSRKAKRFLHLIKNPTFKEGDFLGMILSEKKLFSNTGTLLESTKSLYETITGISLRKT